MSRGLEVPSGGTGDDLELWIEPRRPVIRAGYGWSFPAGDELRVGVGSFDPAEATSSGRRSRWRTRSGLPSERYQGNSIRTRCERRRRTVSSSPTGDSAGHCLPVTAEGIRTAFYFGVAAGATACGAGGAADARGGAGALSGVLDAHRLKYGCLLQAQHTVPRLGPLALGAMARAFARGGVSHWAFGHYLRIAPAEFALPAPPAAVRVASSAGALAA